MLIMFYEKPAPTTSEPPPQQNGAGSAPTAPKLTPLQLLRNRLRTNDSALTAPEPVITDCTKKSFSIKFHTGRSIIS